MGNAQVQGHYDKKTGRLTSITYDSNKNGKIDTWSYMDGARVLRIEIDKDEDGKVDRWEYYTPDQKLEKVGYSRADNGRPDAWAYQGADGTIARIDLADQSEVRGPKSEVRSQTDARSNLARGAPAESRLGAAFEGPQRDGADAPRARIVRTEYYEKGVLVRAEEDSNGDGRIDKWETYENGTLTVLALDTTGRGTPDRRLVYRANGTVRLEK